MAKNTVPIRSDPELKKIIDQVFAKNLMRGNNIPRTRVTTAIVNQYKKYPNLMKELMDTNLK